MTDNEPLNVIGGGLTHGFNFTAAVNFPIEAGIKIAGRRRKPLDFGITGEIKNAVRGLSHDNPRLLAKEIKLSLIDVEQNISINAEASNLSFNIKNTVGMRKNVNGVGGYSDPHLLTPETRISLNGIVTENKIPTSGKFKISVSVKDGNGNEIKINSDSAYIVLSDDVSNLNLIDNVTVLFKSPRQWMYVPEEYTIEINSGDNNK